MEIYGFKLERRGGNTGEYAKDILDSILEGAEEGVHSEQNKAIQEALADRGNLLLFLERVLPILLEK